MERFHCTVKEITVYFSFRKYKGNTDYYLENEKLAQRPHMKALGLGINLFFI